MKRIVIKFHHIEIHKVTVYRRIGFTISSVEPMDHDGPSGSYGANTFYANLRRPETR